MRVSSSMIFDSGVSTMQKRTAEVLKLQQQLATNRRMLTPSDDPVAAAQALEVTQSNNVNTLYMQNQDNANDTLASGESTLDSAVTLLQSMYERMVQLGDGSLNDQDRLSITTGLRENFKELMGIANQTDGLGNYLFSGYSGNTQPFIGDIDNGVSYVGDAGHRELQVSPTRNLQVTESGLDVFMRVPNTSVPFKADAAAANTGNAVISKPIVTDTSLWNDPSNPQIYSVTFTDTSAGAGTSFSYDVTDYLGVSIGGGTYTPPLDASGNPALDADGNLVTTQITIPGKGAEFSITGTPADGDVVNINPAGTTDVFSVISAIVLESEQGVPSVGGDPKTKFNEQLGFALSNIQSAHDNVLKYQSGFGARMQEADSQNSASSERGLEYTSTLSRLQDLDTVKAISDLTMTQTTLQAAQLSFSQVSKLSLFNYL